MTSAPKLPLTEATFGSALSDLEQLSREYKTFLYFMPLEEATTETPGPSARLIAEWKKGVPPHTPPDDKWIEVYGYLTDQELGYWATIHEFGHAALGHFADKAASVRYINNLVQHEAEAWSWALDASPYEFGEKPSEYMRYHWFATYLRNGKWTHSPEIERMSAYVELGGTNGSD